MTHITVLKKETVALLNKKNNGIYIDLTLGGGGHSLEILKFDVNLHLICFDLDLNSLESFKEVLETEGFRVLELSPYTKLLKDKKEVILVNENFVNLEEILKNLNISKVDGVIADLGWSTDQLDGISGLSFEKRNEELDMRFDENLGVKASDLLNVLNQEQLVKMFERYADFRVSEAKKLASQIIAFRKNNLFIKTHDLLQVVESTFPVAPNNTVSGKHFLARVFQALRLAVNQELPNLESVLPQIFNLLNSGENLAIITFHSGEDAIVRAYFKKLYAAGKVEFITKSIDGEFLRPSVDELKNNLKARSAKLWGVKKL